MLTAVILRFLRSKLFLTAIFFASFTYFVVNFYNDVSIFFKRISSGKYVIFYSSYYRTRMHFCPMKMLMFMS